MTPLPAPKPAHLRPAIFIDKDGLLIGDVALHADPDAVRFVPSACESLAALAACGFAVVVVTHLVGLARGRSLPPRQAHLQSVLQQRLRDEAGVELAGFLGCPHAPGPGGWPACACRKPAPGLLLEATRTHRLDLSRSWMVGSTLDDVEAGRRAGCRSLLLDMGSETVWRQSPVRVPHGRCLHWGEVAYRILEAQEPVAEPQSLR